MKITNEEIKHLAALSNFSISDEEIPPLSNDLENILKYVSQLDELDTKDIKPTFQCIEMENIWRSDEIQENEASREQLLSLTKEEKENQIKVPKVL